ncbi:hypothetical protein [Streptomyces sp. 8N706]|uniref:hypothetical protein n=1 Tax=Streptomyces sp. 8N706 TaxID=3457416 RepID=UPI003FD4DC43
MTLNAARLRRGARVLVPLLGAITLTGAVTSSAAANPSAVVRVGGQIRYAALPAETNAVTFSDLAGTFLVTDTPILTAGPGCTQLTTGSATCGPTATVTSIGAALGDGDDSAVVTDDILVPAAIDGGLGEDSIDGGGGSDRLNDPDGWDSPPTTNTFNGGPGNDAIVSRNQGFDVVDCGPGIDTVVADSAALDSVVNCEFVQRS